MTDWFDILMKVLTVFAIFIAGYNIGWERGFKRCRESMNAAIKQVLDSNTELVNMRKKLKEYETRNTLSSDCVSAQREELTELSKNNLWQAERIESLLRERDALRKKVEEYECSK